VTRHPTALYHIVVSSHRPPADLLLSMEAERLELSGVWQAHHQGPAPSRRPQDHQGTRRHHAARWPLQRLVGRTAHRPGLTTSFHAHAMEFTRRAPPHGPAGAPPAGHERRAHRGPRRDPGSPATLQPALACPPRRPHGTPVSWQAAPCGAPFRRRTSQTRAVAVPLHAG
jgi:hypothetical protein